jgi:general secretion pathway protein F
MPHYRYRAVTPAGEIVVGEVEAPSRAEVVRRIEYLGHLPIEAEVATEGVLRTPARRAGKPPKPRDVTIFLRQLALLIRAGLTLEGALQTLADDTNKALARFATGLRSAIASGDGFAEALERHATLLDPAYIAMVRAGEGSGKLDVVLRAIVEDRTRQERLAERISSTLHYPLLLVVAAIVILVFFLAYVVPKFAPVFKDLGGRLNAGAAFVLAASNWLQGNLTLLMVVALVAILASWLALSRREWRAAIVATLGKLPGVAGPMRDRRAARLIGTLGLLIENGVALPAALRILRGVVIEPQYVAAIDRVHDQVRNGRRFADALADTDLLPPLAVRMLRVGDETGDLASIATHASEFYEYRLAQGLDRLMGAVGPVTIIVVSIVIGALVVSIMSALLSITELAL